jgi:hypothetical protein
MRGWFFARDPLMRFFGADGACANVGFVKGNAGS